MSTRTMADEEFVELLREMGEADPGVTIYEFCRAIGCSFSVIYRRFGSWPDLRERAGLPRVGRRGTPQLASEDAIREAFRKAIAEHGSELTMTRFCQLTGFSRDAVHRRCGGWRALRREEGVKDEKPVLPLISDDQVRAEYARVKKMLGRPPSYRELGALSHYGEKTFRSRFYLFRWRARIREVLKKKIAERKAELAAEAARRGGPTRLDERIGAVAE